MKFFSLIVPAVLTFASGHAALVEKAVTYQQGSVTLEGFHVYDDAFHSFTHPKAGNDVSKGAAYNESADRRSWVAMQAFFTELFK